MGVSFQKTAYAYPIPLNGSSALKFIPAQPQRMTYADTVAFIPPIFGGTPDPYSRPWGVRRALNHFMMRSYEKRPPRPANALMIFFKELNCYQFCLADKK